MYTSIGIIGLFCLSDDRNDIVNIYILHFGDLGGILRCYGKIMKKFISGLVGFVCLECGYAVN